MEPFEIMAGEKIKYRGKVEVYYKTYNEYKERCEKDFLMKCFASLPIEKQKEFLNFEEINPFSKEEPKSYEEAEYREMLFQKQVIEFRSEIII